MILLIIIFTGLSLEVEKFDNMQFCLERSKNIIGEIKKDVIDPGFYPYKIKAELAFCVQGNTN